MKGKGKKKNMCSRYSFKTQLDKPIWDRNKAVFKKK